MPLITVPQVQPTDEVNPDSVNNGVNAIANVVNGQLDDANIKDRGISADKIDFATGVWWEELASTTLHSSSSSITLSGYTPKTFMKVLMKIAAANGDLALELIANGDTSANYTYRQTIFDDSYTSTKGTSATKIPIASGVWPLSSTIEISIVERELFITGALVSSSGVTNLTTRSVNVFGKYYGASSISSITLRTAQNNIATGSKLVLLGHD